MLQSLKISIHLGGTNIIFNLGGWGKTIYWFCVWNIHLGVFCNDTISVFMFILEFTMISYIALIIFGWNFAFYLSENNKLFKLVYYGSVCGYMFLLYVYFYMCVSYSVHFVCVYKVWNEPSYDLIISKLVISMAL